MLILMRGILRHNHIYRRDIIKCYDCCRFFSSGIAGDINGFGFSCPDCFDDPSATRMSLLSLQWPIHLEEAIVGAITDFVLGADKFCQCGLCEERWYNSGWVCPDVWQSHCHYRKKQSHNDHLKERFRLKRGGCPEHWLDAGWRCSCVSRIS